VNGYDEPLQVSCRRVIDESGRRHRAVNFKRLEKGRFAWPTLEANHLEWSGVEPAAVLGGIDLKDTRRRPRYALRAS
jgi:hypothetical protein